MTKEILIKSAIKLLVNEQVKQGSWGYALEEDSAYEVSWKDVLKWLEQQPKTGKWIKIEPYPLQMHEYKCSECGHETDDNTENYCSECGAKMEAKE